MHPFKVRIDDSFAVCGSFSSHKNANPAADIRLFLSSRYGIIVTEEEVKESILGGLGGGEHYLEGDGDALDLMEVVACLLIPTLLKAAQQHQYIPLPSNVVPANEKLLETVWSIMLHDVSRNTMPLSWTILNKIALRSPGTVQQSQ